MVAKAFAAGLAKSELEWPRISVILCTYNGQRYIDEGLSAIECLDYPNFEVIVVDDGSTDATAEIVRRHNVRLIQTENHGLSSARNVGLGAATGDIVAYIDDDAYPDSDWLKRLALTFLEGQYAGVGGPNIPPPNDLLVAQCVAHAPGGPLHVLLSDREAEHIPGCNMAFRRQTLLDIGGFDPQFRTAGDDVDICWRIQQHGWKLGFSPAATVFHHRRDSLRSYWKQQVGYGKAEAILERKWPDKYNSAGYLTWSGRIYNPQGLTPLWWRRGRIYHGTWGTAGYQRLYQPAASLLGELALLPEWYLLICFFATLSLIGLIWEPLLIAIPLLVLAGGFSIAQAAISSSSTAALTAGRGTRAYLKVFGISMILHLAQPVARLCGRIKFGLHPWRHRGAPPQVMFRAKTVSIWSEAWRTPEEWLSHLQSKLRSEGTVCVAGGGYDDWDLEIQGGMLAAVRTRIAVEEHGAGLQMLRFRIWPRCSPTGFFASVLIAMISGTAAYDRSWVAAALLFSISVVMGGRILYECAHAMHKLTATLEHFKINDREQNGAVTDPKPLALPAVARNT
jgi:GT2 family glycosyltransferase